MSFMRPVVILMSLLFTLVLVSGGGSFENAEARSFKGGRMFKKSVPSYKAPAQKQNPAGMQQKRGFGSGLAGGLLGGALGALLFGSLFGMGGQGMGILPLLLLAGIAFFIFKSFTRRQAMQQNGYRAPPGSPPPGQTGFDSAMGTQDMSWPTQNPVGEGLNLIRQTDPGFDEKYFVEIASDVFFQVQAGWMRRDISSYRHLLGSQLADEYERHFGDMAAKGQLNKLENIAIRSVEIVAAGSENGEDFVTVLFTANLLDYVVDEQSGDLVSGSMTEPVKFAEEWSWARPVRTQEWRLEGIEVVEDW